MKIINMIMKFIDNRKIIENIINFMGISNNKKIYKRYYLFYNLMVDY